MKVKESDSLWESNIFLEILDPNGGITGEKRTVDFAHSYGYVLEKN